MLERVKVFSSVRSLLELEADEQRSILPKCHPHGGYTLCNRGHRTFDANMYDAHAQMMQEPLASLDNPLEPDLAAMARDDREKFDKTVRDAVAKYAT